jgi:hypothetical protein
MGFLSRIGSKAYSGLKAGTRVGIKALGTAHRVGNKIAEVGSKAVQVVEASPFGARLKKPLAIAKTTIGLVQKASDLAGKGHEVLTKVDKITKAGESALQKPSGAGAGNKVAHDLGAGLQQQKVSQRDITLGSDVPKSSGGRAPRRPLGGRQ